MVKKREIILVEAYTFEQDAGKAAILDWKALEYNAYQKIYTPVASAPTREALLDTLDLLFTGGSKEDKLKEKIRKIDPEVLARLIDKFESDAAVEQAEPKKLTLDHAILKVGDYENYGTSEVSIEASKETESEDVLPSTGSESGNALSSEGWVKPSKEEK